MAGGLFGRPFYLNEKCIIFSLICMALFLYNPTFYNKYFLYLTLFFIFVIAYIAMAWYDYYFNCDLVPFKRGKYSFTGLFKPPAHVPEYQFDKSKKILNTYDKLNETNYRRLLLIYGMHFLFISPILAYVAIYGNKSNTFIYPILGFLSLFTAAYHGLALIFASH